MTAAELLRWWVWLITRLGIRYVPPPTPEWAAGLPVRLAEAEVAIARSEERADAREPWIEPKECNRLHPHPDLPFMTSKLGFVYQECDSCGQITGYAVT